MVSLGRPFAARKYPLRINRIAPRLRRPPQNWTSGAAPWI